MLYSLQVKFLNFKLNLLNLLNLGATYFNNTGKWNNIFNNLVANRTIFCYSDMDYIVRYIFSATTKKEGM